MPYPDPIDTTEHPGFWNWAQGWLLDLARRTAQDPTAKAIVAGNVLAAALALFQPSVTISLMFFYWLECLVVGLFNVVKLAYVPPLDTSEADFKKLSPTDAVGQRGLAMGVFILHYGMFLFMCFTLIHWLAVREMGDNLSARAYYGGILLPAAILTVVHGVSFYANFLGKREYAGRTGVQQMFQPYGRVVLICVAAFFGIALVSMTGMPATAAVLFVPIKLVADLHAHFRDHGGPAAAETPSLP